MPPRRRADRIGEHRTAFERNKQIILSTQRICGICGRPVDFTFKYPHPLSPTIDHIIPIAKGGHPSDLDNLQLAHRTCNRQKSDKLFAQNRRQGMAQQIETKKRLPLHFDWINYKPPAEKDDGNG